MSLSETDAPNPPRRPASLLTRLARAGASAAGAKLFATLATLLNYGLLSRRFEDEQVAAFVVLNAVAVLGALAAGLGLPQLVLRRVRACELRGDHAGARVVIGRAIWRALTGGAVASAAVWFWTTVQPDSLGEGVGAYRVYAVLWLLAMLLCQFFGEAARAYERFAVASAVNSLNGGVLPNLVLALLLTVGAPLVTSLESVLVGQIVGLAIAATLGIVFCRPKTANQASTAEQQAVEPPKGDLPGDPMLSQSLPMLVSQVLVVGLTHFEILLVRWFATDADVAAYGAIRRLMQVVGSPLLLANASLPTFVVELHSAGNRAKLEQLLRSGATAAALPAAVLVAAILVAPGAWLSRFDPGYASAAPALVMMSLAALVFVFAGSFGIVLRMTGHQQWGMANGLVSGGLYLAIAPLAASQYGLLGVAASTALLVACRNVTGTLLVRRFVGVWCVPWLSPAPIRSQLGELAKRFQKRSLKGAHSS